MYCVSRSYSRSYLNFSTQNISIGETKLKVYVWKLSTNMIQNISRFRTCGNIESVYKLVHHLVHCSLIQFDVTSCNS